MCGFKKVEESRENPRYEEVLPFRGQEGFDPKKEVNKTRLLWTEWGQSTWDDRRFEKCLLERLGS